MKAYLIPTHHPSATPRLILLFAGWGMDFHPFLPTHPNGYDLCVVWDYRDSFISPLDNGEAFGDMLSDYGEIAVVAWSFGVPAASRFISEHPHLPITAKIAVNGTQHPIDNDLGIPQAIFQGTLDGLSEKSLTKFHLRMAGSGSAYKSFADHLPERAIDELKDELIAISRSHSPIIRWDKAIIYNSDRIIPPANQLKGWEEEAFEIIQRPGAHLPDFASLLSEFLNDKTLVKRRFHNASTTYDDSAVVQHQIADRLLSLITLKTDTHHDILEIGCGTGYLTRNLRDRIGKASLHLWDLTISEHFSREFSSPTSFPKACDAEIGIRTLPDSSLDVIVSASTVQWFNSLPEFFRQVERVLRKGGKAVISTFGPLTMQEINHTLGKPSPYPTLSSLRRMIPKALSITHLFDESIAATFPSPLDALRHIQLTGVNALNSTSSPSVVRSLIRNYPLDCNGEATITYQPIYIVLEKKLTV